MIGLQLLIIVLVAFVVKTIINFGHSIEQTGMTLKPDNFMLMMGNIAALPQLVIAVVMFDIFSYNIVNEHVISIWLIILILAIIGGIILTVFFLKAFLSMR